MTDFQPSRPTRKVERVSMVKETRSALKECWLNVLPIILVFCLIWTGINIATPKFNYESPVAESCKFQENMNDCLKAHAVEISLEQNISIHAALMKLPMFIIIWIMSLILNLAFNYMVSIAYMKQTMESPPDNSLEGFWYYSKKIVWKHLLPIYWNFIPLIGQVMYIRALIRYELVGPMALLQSGTELETSWKMTEGKAWRIFGAALSVGLICGIAIIPIAILSTSIVAVSAIGGDIGNSINSFNSLEAISTLITSSGVALLTTANVLFSFAVYRVLLKEA